MKPSKSHRATANSQPPRIHANTSAGQIGNSTPTLTDAAPELQNELRLLGQDIFNLEDTAEILIQRLLPVTRPLPKVGDQGANECPAPYAELTQIVSQLRSRVIATRIKLDEATSALAI